MTTLPTLEPTRDSSRLELLIDKLGVDALLAHFTEDEWGKILYDWEWNHRDGQKLPAGEWSSTVWQCGRGWGKTRVGVESVIGWAEAGEPYPMYLVGPTGDDVRSVMVEGESGIMAKSPPWFMPEYQPSKRRLIWPNGVIAYTRSGDRPDRLRGPQGSKAWVDELCAMRYAEQVRDQLDMMIRLGDPRVIYTTTPRPTKLFREILAEPDTIVIRGRTMDNRRHLSRKFMKRVYRRHAGTRLGRQELEGDLLDDNPGALWKLKQIDALRVLRAPELIRVGVGVDPSVSTNPKSNETGIITAGVGMCSCKGTPELHAFVFDDRSAVMTPDEWAKAVAAAYHAARADKVVPEVNNGGDLVISNLRTLGDPDLAILMVDGKPGVHASRGKLTRADPVSSLYEQRKVHHVGTLSGLEDQMTQWNPLVEHDSPDRVDALVWVLTWLMLGIKGSDWSSSQPRAGGTSRVPSRRG